MNLLSELTESQLISSKSGYHRFTGQQLSELLYLHILAFRILSCEESENEFLHRYAQKVKYWNGFEDWHQNGNDLYLLIHGVTAPTDPDMKIAKSSIKYLETLALDTKHLLTWIRAIAARNGVADNYASRYFLTLDRQLKINNASWRSIRRLAMNWPDIRHRDQQLAMTRLLQLLRSRCPMSDIIAPMNKLASHKNLELKDANNLESENSLTLTQVAAHHHLAEDGEAAIATTTADIAPFVKPFKKVRRRNAK